MRIRTKLYQTVKSAMETGVLTLKLLQTPGLVNLQASNPVKELSRRLSVPPATGKPDPAGRHP